VSGLASIQGAVVCEIQSPRLSHVFARLLSRHTKSANCPMSRTMYVLIYF
jgi:hypothetical protein